MSALASPETEAEGDGGVVLGGASSIAVSSMFEGVMEGSSGRVWLGVISWLGGLIVVNRSGEQLGTVCIRLFSEAIATLYKC